MNLTKNLHWEHFLTVPLVEVEKKIPKEAIAKSDPNRPNQAHLQRKIWPTLVLLGLKIQFLSHLKFQKFLKSYIIIMNLKFCKINFLPQKKCSPHRLHCQLKKPTELILDREVLHLLYQLQGKFFLRIMSKNDTVSRKLVISKPYINFFFFLIIVLKIIPAKIDFFFLL